MKREMACPENTYEEQNILTELIKEAEAAGRMGVQTPGKIIHQDLG